LKRKKRSKKYSRVSNRRHLHLISPLTCVLYVELKLSKHAASVKLLFTANKTIRELTGPCIRKLAKNNHLVKNLRMKRLFRLNRSKCSKLMKIKKFFMGI
jgi:hypothetical protein